MNEIYVDIRSQNRWITKHFNNKEFVTISELLDCIEELDGEIDHLNEELKEARKTDEERYDEHLMDEADNYYDEVKMGLIK